MLEKLTAVAVVLQGNENATVGRPGKREMESTEMRFKEDIRELSHGQGTK
jgi:hypothetical protein